MSKELKDIDLIKANQQITGFYHCYQGYDLKSLCNSMGLTQEEYKEMLSKGMLDYLPEELGEELNEHFKIIKNYD